jgi:hypothetical protein
MKPGLLWIAILVFASLTYSQSGRRAKPTASPIPSPVEELKPSPKPEQPDPSPVTAERNQDYRCTDDGSLTRMLETMDANERIVSAKEADEPVQNDQKAVSRLHSRGTPKWRPGFCNPESFVSGQQQGVACQGIEGLTGRSHRKRNQGGLQNSI